MCKVCGGTVTNEHGEIVYDSGFEYDHQIFRNNFKEFESLYGELV